MGFTIQITADHDAMERFKRNLEGIPNDELKKRIADAVAQEGVIPRARYYPPEPGRPQPFKTTKQRRAFFAMLRDGRIKVPYPRTNRLRNAWQQVNGDPFTVSNDTRYATLVQGQKNEQARYHEQTGWFTVERIAQETQDNDAERLAVGAMMEWLVSSGLT